MEDVGCLSRHRRPVTVLIYERSHCPDRRAEQTRVRIPSRSSLQFGSLVPSFRSRMHEHYGFRKSDDPKLTDEDEKLSRALRF